MDNPRGKLQGLGRTKSKKEGKMKAHVTNSGEYLKKRTLFFANHKQLSRKISHRPLTFSQRDARIHSPNSSASQSPRSLA
jgi:hypothetical protein